MANKIITIDYSQTFSQMMSDVGVPRYQKEKIFKQLDSKEISFPHKGEVSFATHDFTFNQATLSRAAAEYIRKHDTEVKWKPFDVEHVLAYFKKYPAKFQANLVFATRRTFILNGEAHIFFLTTNRDHADLELIPDNHAWSPAISIFPGQRKV